MTRSVSGSRGERFCTSSLRALCVSVVNSQLGEGHRLSVEGGHDFLGKGAQTRDRGARRREQYMLDAAGFEPLQLRDDLLRRAEQRRVVEFERVLVLLDVRIALGAGAAREIADILEHL